MDENLERFLEDPSKWDQEMLAETQAPNQTKPLDLDSKYKGRNKLRPGKKLEGEDLKTALVRFMGKNKNKEDNKNKGQANSPSNIANRTLSSEEKKE